MVDSTDDLDDNARNPLPLGIAAVDFGVDHVAFSQFTRCCAMLPIELFVLVLIEHL